MASPDEAQLLLFEEVIQSFPYPVILTDPQGNPTAFRNLDDLELDRETGPWSPAERLALRQEAARMDRIAAPYPVTDESGDVIQVIHVSEAGTIQDARIPRASTPVRPAPPVRSPLMPAAPGCPAAAAPARPT